MQGIHTDEESFIGLPKWSGNKSWVDVEGWTAASLSHEELHGVVFRLAGFDASLALDSIRERTYRTGEGMEGLDLRGEFLA
jgi:hypothetical protein